MNKKGVSFVKGSPMYEADLQRTDSYSVVISKIAQALDVDDTTDVVLLTTRGCIIRDELIDTGGGENSNIDVRRVLRKAAYCSGKAITRYWTSRCFITAKEKENSKYYLCVHVYLYGLQ